MTRIHEEVKAHLEQVNLRTKLNVDKHWRSPINYNPGDLVWLSSTNIPSDRPSRKLDYRFLGPYVIVEKVGHSAYKIKTPGRSTRHATFNETLLKKHNKGQFPSQQTPPPPPPELKDGFDEWEVEEIKDSRFSRNQLQYLIHWKGYDLSEDSWEPASHLRHAQELVQEFHLRYPDKPKPRRRNQIMRM